MNKISLQADTYSKFQLMFVIGVFSLNNRQNYSKVTGNKNPTNEELLMFWATYPDTKHSGAAHFGEMFQMAPKEQMALGH